MTSYSLTRSRTIQYVGILLVLGLIAVGYWYFNVRAGVKTNTTAGSAVGDGGLGAGLVGYWKLDEGTGTSAASTSVNTLTGTLTNGPTWTTGQVRSAVDFDGTNDYITVADNAAVDFGDTDAFTLTGWFNRDTFTTDDVIIAKANDGALSLGYIVVIDDATDQLGFIAAVDGSNYYASGSSSAFTATGWHHFAITWNGAAAAVYIDGVSNEQTPGSSGSVGNLSNSLTFNIGSESDGGNPFDGKLDEIRVYDRMLSSSEITDLYKLTVPTAVDTGLVGYWAFGADDIRSTLVSDRSGARNTGTLVNAPTKTIGRIGQAFNFVSASTQYINAGSGAIIDDIVNLSTCAWVKPNTSLTTYGDVITKYDNSGVGWQMLLDYTTYSALNLGFFRYYTSTAGFWHARTTIPYNEWTHVCMSYNSSSVANDPVFYVNGVLISTTENTAPSGTLGGDNNGSLYIGAYNNAGSPGELFDGAIDEARVYNRIITASEAKALYDAGSASKVNTSAAQPEGTGNPDSGLVGYWKLDEGTGTSAADSSVNAITAGTLTNGPTWGTGQIGSAVTLDGTNDYIALSDPANGALDFGDTDDMTIAGWFNRSTFTTTDVIIGKWDGTSPGYRVYIDDANDALHFQLFDGTDTYAIDANGFGITAAGWHHFAAVWDQDSPANSELYLDGRALSATDSGTIGNIGTLANTVALSIGETPGSGISFAGSLDEIRIYDRAFTSEEVVTLYNQTAATGVDTSLKGYWSFNAPDTPSTTAYDRSGARNTGTLTNGPTKGIGRVGQALNFDGTNDYVDAGSAASLDDIVNLTACIWLKPSSLGSGLVALAKGDWTTGWSLSTTTGTALEFIRGWSGGATYGEWITPSDVIAAGEWTHFCATYNNSSTANDPILYVNGVAVATTEANAPVGTADSDASLVASVGTYGAGVGAFFAGSLDEARIYNRILAANEIKSLYDLSAPDKVNTSASTPQGTGNLDSGLAGYWKLDENTGSSAADSSTNAIAAGTLTNGPTWTTGQVGSAVDFDGTNDYITVADNAAIDFGDTDDMTITGWFNRDTATTTDEIIAKWDGVGAGYRIFMSDSLDAIAFEINDGVDTYDLLGTTTFTAPGWHHFAVVWDQDSAANTEVYVDGRDDNAADGGTIGNIGSVANALALNVGAEAGGTANFFDGKLDEIRIYDRALSPEEIGNLYRLSTPTGTDTGLVGYWSMNGQDTSATIAYDRSGASNDGTLTNGPTKAIGKLGQALDLDGTNDYVDLGSAASLDSIVNLSICAWINSSTTSYADIISKYGSAGAWEFLVDNVNPGPPRLAFVRGFSSQGGYWLGPSGTIVAGTWKHVCVTYNNSSTANDPIFYEDGNVVAVTEQETPSGTLLSDAAATAMIGGYHDGSSPQITYDGKIDEVRLYNRILTAAEIQSLYNSGR